jgi:hypothetical protein
VREIVEVELVLLPLRLVEPELLALVVLERLRALPAPERVRKRTKFSVIATNTVTAANKSRLAR